MAVVARAFGERTVTRAEGGRVKFPVTTAERLFWYLLLFPEGRSRDLVIGEFFDTEVTSKSLTLLRVTVHRVRKAIGYDDAVIGTGDRITLAPEILENADIVRFGRSLARARVETCADRRAEMLRETLELAGGEFAPGLDADWADAARGEIAFATAEARLELAELACAARRCEEALVHLGNALSADPLLGEDRAQHHLICLAALRGPEQALAEFERYSRALRDEIGDGPAPETLRLVQRIQTRELICDGARYFPPLAHA